MILQVAALRDEVLDTLKRTSDPGLALPGAADGGAGGDVQTPGNREDQVNHQWSHQGQDGEASGERGDQHKEIPDPSQDQLERGGGEGKRG